MVAVLGGYARRMGVDPALVRTAKSLPPDTVHVLSRDEMRRWSLATSGFLVSGRGNEASHEPEAPISNLAAVARGSCPHAILDLRGRVAYRAASPAGE